MVTLLSFVVLHSPHMPCEPATPHLLPFPKHITSFTLKFAVFSSAWNTLHNLQAENSHPQCLHLYNRVVTVLTSEGCHEDYVWHSPALSKCYVSLSLSLFWFFFPNLNKTSPLIKVFQDLSRSVRHSSSPILYALL